MTVYHISETLHEGDELVSGHQHLDRMAEPFLQALEMGGEWFHIMILQGKYMFAVMSRSGLREWANYAKWSTEAVFEYVRRTEFPHCCSRLHCNYYYTSEALCRRLYSLDWGGESAEVRSRIHLFAIELDDPAPRQYDMNLYDLAYEAMENRQDVDEAIRQARRYFSGEATQAPVWEILSDRPARAVRVLADGGEMDGKGAS